MILLYLTDCVDLMNRNGTVVNLETKELSADLASSLLAERQHYVLLQVCRESSSFSSCSSSSLKRDKITSESCTICGGLTWDRCHTPTKWWNEVILRGTVYHLLPCMYSVAMKYNWNRRNIPAATIIKQIVKLFQFFQFWRKLRLLIFSLHWFWKM